MPEQYESIWTNLYDLDFTQGYIDAGGIRTRYIEAGPADAPPVLMLHGGGGTWENFTGNIRAHSAHFRTIAYDMVGHGLSGKPNHTMMISDYVAHLGAFMDALDIERASLVGLSLGSWVSTKFTVLNPERVEKVTMISAWGRPQGEVAASDTASLKHGRRSRLGAVENPTWEAMDDIFTGLIADPAKRMPDLLRLRQNIYRQPEMRQAMANIFTGFDPDVWPQNAIPDDEVKTITCPYLIIAHVDHEDEFLKSSYEYHALIPGSRVVELHGASHWAQWEAKDEFNKANIAFLLER